MNRVAIASDHAGYLLKEDLRRYLIDKGFDVTNFGAHSETSVDYPDYAGAAARAVQSGDADFGLLVCGTGIGMSIAANKFTGVRCALCSDTYSARLARAHNNANMIALGSRVTGSGLARDILDAYLGASFEERHQRRIDKVTLIESGNGRSGG